MDILRDRLYFIAWHMPGNRDHGGRVQLIPPGNIYDPEFPAARTAEEVHIPAGAVIEYVTEEPSPI